MYMKRARGKGLGIIGVSDSRGVASMQKGRGGGIMGLGAGGGHTVCTVDLLFQCSVTDSLAGVQERGVRKRIYGNGEVSATRQGKRHRGRGKR
jgi:hypothetical protein